MGSEPSPKSASSRDAAQMEVLEDIHEDMSRTGPVEGLNRLTAATAMLNLHGFGSKKTKSK
jgi:hypothetical protein